MAIGTTRNQLDEYSDLNISFHQAIITLSTSQWLAMMTESLVIQMCAIRARTIGENDRASRSIIDHMNLRTVLEDRDADLTECLSRGHTLGLAAPVEQTVTYLDERQLTPALG
jgi:DNA-binding GntR family transcriptional regulator